MNSTQLAFLRWFKTTYEFNKFDMDDEQGLLMQNAFQAGMEYADRLTVRSGEREYLRAAQAAAVMPLIGKICDEIEEMNSDFRDSFEDEANELYCLLLNIASAMEDAE